MIQKLFILPLALAAAVSFAGPAAACGDKAACGACKADQQSAAPAAAPKDAKVATTTYKVDAMHCQSCVNAISTKLKTVPGVSKVEANLDKKTVTVTHAKGQADLAKLQAGLAGTSYKLAAAPAAMADDCCAAESDACKDEAKTSAVPKAGEQCKAECKEECNAEHAPAAAPAKPAPKK